MEPHETFIIVLSHKLQSNTNYFGILHLVTNISLTLFQQYLIF